MIITVLQFNVIEFLHMLKITQYRPSSFLMPLTSFSGVVIVTSTVIALYCESSHCSSLYIFVTILWSRKAKILLSLLLLFVIVFVIITFLLLFFSSASCYYYLLLFRLLSIWNRKHIANKNSFMHVKWHLLNPSILQATSPSSFPKRSLHTVPHVPLCKISRRPL